MKCASPHFPPGLPDEALQDYFFEALSVEDTQPMRDHVSHCAECQQELDRLRMAALTLRALPDEEIPRRIAFVSDKVFSPSPLVRFWSSYWLSGARLASAAAMVLAGAIVFHAYHQPPVISRAATTQAVDYRPEMQMAVNAAVTRAVADAESRYDVKLRRVVEANQLDKRATMVRVEELLQAMDRRNRVMTVASNRTYEAGQ